MDEGSVFLELAGSVAAFWLALYTALLIFMWRALGRRLRVDARLIRRAFRLRSRPAVVDGVEAGIRSGFLVCLAAAFAPALLIVGPLLLATGALVIAAQIVHVQ